MGGKWTQSGGLLAAIVTVAVSMAGAQARFDADAVRLNNRGVALMGQQFTEKAEQSFAASFKKDPKLAQAAINDGIALLTLQKIDDAKKVLQAALVLDPDSAQGWYNLGLAQHADNELDDALKSFASETLPTLQDHLKQAKEMMKTVGGTTAAKGTKSKASTSGR